MTPDHRYLLLPEWLVTMDPDTGTLRDGALLTEGSRIAYCGPRQGLPALSPPPEIIDLRAHIVLPGLVNAHTHLPMTLLRGLADDLPLHVWLREHIFPAEARHMTPEGVDAGARLGIAELLLGGVTCCADGYFREHIVLEAAAELGLRGVFAQGILDAPTPDGPEPGQAWAALESLVREPARALQIPAVFAHSVYTCSRETLRRAWALARETGRRFFIHAAETAWETDWCRRHADGLSPVALLDRLGLLNPGTVLVHAVHVSPADADLIARRGCAVVLNTESNSKLASGIAPAHLFLERGVTLALGTDGAASNNDLDLFGEMAATARTQKLARQDPAALPAETVLRLATAGGARALGLGHRIGMLRAGHEADVIAVRTDLPRACPLHDPVSHLVYSASAADVDLVLVAGVVRQRNRRLPDVPLADLMNRARRLAASVRPPQAPQGEAGGPPPRPPGPGE